MTSGKEYAQIIEKLKQQWKILWRDRIDDRLRAEGIADKDYSLLFVERGTVIVATRKYKPLDFSEILQQHLPPCESYVTPPKPTIGGWGKFVRNVLNKQKGFTRRMRPEPPKPAKKVQQRKKGGRGWLHLKRK